MATKHTTTVEDDIDGTADAATVTFGLHGVAYSIDLGPKNLDKLTKVLAPFIAKATKQKTETRPTSRPKSNGKDGRGYDIARLREWAATNNIEVPSRGRMPAWVVAEYQAAGGR